MPFTTSERPLSGRFADFGVTANPTGGYTRTSRPNPNDPMEMLRRRQPGMIGGGEGIGQKGSQTLSMLPQGATNAPTITASGDSALGANMALAQRARDRTLEYQAGEAARREAAGNTGMAALAPMTPMASPWDALLQAMYESGADQLRGEGGMRNMGQRETDAGTVTTYRKTPGFYGTQTPQITRAQNTMSPREVALLQEMAKQSATAPRTPAATGRRR